MRRFLFAFALTIIACTPALAQDMPLSQILIDGEGWKKQEPDPGATVAPLLSTHSPDGKTEFRWTETSGAFLEAKQTGTQQPFAPYCPLRTKRGQKRIVVRSLTTDKDGRIYALTEIGVQVFDPTGRMCGVLTPAAPGTPNSIGFEGDQLAVWIAGTKYTRKLRTQGVT